MKDQILKIAKVKSEKEFYKKYPTEAAFFKAHPEAKKQIKKANFGTYIGGDGSTASSTRYTNSNEIPINGINTGGTTTPHFLLVDVFSYAGSTNKTCLMEISHDRNGSGYVERAVGLWRSTAAITSVTITLNTGNMAIGTTATLYGIKNA